MDEQRGASDADSGAGDVLTRVCLTCGQEYYLTGGEAGGKMVCEKCGSTVFREFLTRGEDDEAARDFADTTGRDLDPDDAEGDTLPGDVIDLDLR
jgi:hypothetical protein